MSSKKTMTCPCCKVEMSVREDGWGQCQTRNCDFVGLVAPELMSMWGNQRTPGTTEIPNAELERLAESLVDFRSLSLQAFRNHEIVRIGAHNARVEAILSHFQPRLDHVAMLRILASDWAKRVPDPPVPQMVAALEAAIEKMEGRA